MKSYLKSIFAVFCLTLILGSSVVTAMLKPVNYGQLYNQEKVNKRSLHLKFKKNSGAEVTNNDFNAIDSASADKLNTILKRASKSKAEKLVSTSKSDNVVATSLKDYYRVSFDKDMDVSNLIKELHATGLIEEAYAQPLPAPSPTADFSSLQQYLVAAPTGINSTYANTVPGGDGSRVKIIDIEYSWNTAHEDLIKVSGALVPNGTPSDPFNNQNHGTAVVGTMVASNNGYGVTGAASGAEIELINANSIERGWDIAGALTLAANRTSPGDVIIIEQQVWGPSFTGSDFLPAEWYAEIYDAIKALTDSGRIVIQPAANGGHNLDDPLYSNGISFPMGKPDSGAIIVGAGDNCSGNTLRSRLSFSNYGSRVNLQGPGNCVVTTGYGDLSAVSTNSLYTSQFSGTSSASPVVASAAAAISSAYEAQSNGQNMSPLAIRNLLISTGTPQSMLSGGSIGAYPNLEAALSFAVRDTSPPSAPTNLSASKNRKQIILKWGAATDNVQVQRYIIYRNGVAYGTVSGNNLTFTDTNLKRRQSYTYSVRAVDSSNNYSSWSNTTKITF